MTDTNKEFAALLLFQDPETGEELRPACEPKDECGGIAIYVSNKDGTRKWKHTIRTEEI